MTRYVMRRHAHSLQTVTIASMEAREQEESSGWVAGMAIVITGLILIVSGGAASVGYYGEWREVAVRGKMWLLILGLWCVMVMQ